MRTLDMLLAHHGGNPIIPLEAAAAYWNFDPDTLAAKIDKGQIKIPYFRLDASQKARRLMRLIDLAEHIDANYASARSDFEKLWS